MKPLIEGCLQTLSHLLSTKDESLIKTLLENKKRLLIGFIRMVKGLLKNKKFLIHVIEAIKGSDLELSFDRFSDCTNFVYENELLDLKSLIRSITQKGGVFGQEENKDNQEK